MVESLATELDRPLANLTLEPGRVATSGAPDAVLYGPTLTDLIGYIETKDLGRNLDNPTGHDRRQFQRYLEGFHAWILTNYVEFRLYENGSETARITLCGVGEVTGSATLDTIAEKMQPELARFFDRFLQQSVPTVNNAETLARLLANKAKILKDELIVLVVGGNPQLLSQLESYRQWLIADLDTEDFGDLYAQTMVYGLFFAAYENTQLDTPLPFDRYSLLTLLPSNIRVVRALFQLLAGQFLPESLNWIIDDLIRLLERANMAAIADEFASSDDPTIYFYETFLTQYNPEERERLGQYYTPSHVVRYITHSVDQLLRLHFDRPDGLASANVTLLDPALGTGTFLVSTLHQIRDNFGPMHAGDLIKHLRDHTLRNFYGFELKAAPYVLAHLKLAQTLSAMELQDSEPRVYLTNTLSDHQPPTRLPGPFEEALSEDGRAAQHVKAEEQILVIMGNPPYSGHSYNQYNRIDDYKFIDGESLGERNTKWLQNDYVKFIRWSEWKIAEFSGNDRRHGIVAFITDNSYLTGPIFRGMRKRLLDVFNRIYILNLHGKTRPPEILPEGVDVDQNVFDIQQGVTISLFVRSTDDSAGRRVFYSDCWGTRESKSDYLTSHDVSTTTWTELDPQAPFYFFVERNLSSLYDRYAQAPRITELMPRYSMGMVTGQDSVAYDFSSSTLTSRFQSLFDAATAQLVQALYRPFDLRWLAYGPLTVTRRRDEIMRHLLSGENIALITFRHTRKVTPMRVCVSSTVVDARLLSSESNCYVFPLYNLFEEATSTGQIEMTPGRQPAFPVELLDNLSSHYNSSVSPETIFYYIYGILNSPAYQAEFEVSLHDDFPRVPFVDDYALFNTVSRHGQRLCVLHLLIADDLEGLSNLTVGFPIHGSDRIERGYPRFDRQLGRIHINSEQFFTGIDEDMWEYRIGDYNPLAKWLESRRNRELTADDRRHFETFATAIRKIVDVLDEMEEVWQGVVLSAWFNPLPVTPRQRLRTRSQRDQA
jgi:predicted helicase